MALLRSEVEVFSQASLKAGYVKTFLERGMAETLENIQFEPFQGKTYEFNIQTSRATGSATRSPFSNAAGPNNVGGVTTINVKMGQLLRDFLVPIAAVKTMNDTNDQESNQAELSADAFFEEYLENYLHGDGSLNLRTTGADATIVGNSLNGLDYWLDVYCGKYVSGAFSTSSSDNVLAYAARFREMKQFATDDGTPKSDTSTWETLTYKHLDNLISLIKGRKQGLVILMHRTVWNRVLESLRASGGNTQQMLVGEALVEAWGTVPVLISDTVGFGKVSLGNGVGTGATIAGGSLDTITIEGTDENGFIGFTDLDIGRVVTVAGANYAGGADAVAHGTAVDDDGQALGANSTRIDTYVDNRTVTTVHAAAGAVDDADFTSERVNVIYVMRLGEMADPLKAIFGAGAARANAGSYNVATNEYMGSIVGFDVRGVGEVQAGGAYYQFRATWDGQFVNENPYNVARLTCFVLS